MATKRAQIAVIAGQGAEIARALAGEGWSLALAGRPAAALARMAGGLGPPERVLCLPADLTRAEEAAEIFAAIAHYFGRIDLMCSVLPRPAPALAGTDWQALADGLTAAVFCDREASRVMAAQRPRGGRIIHCGAVAAGLSVQIAGPARAEGIEVLQLDHQAALAETLCGAGQPDLFARPGRALA